MPGYMGLYEPNLKSALKIDDFPIFRHLPYKKLLQILTYPGFPYHILSQEALNIWRGKLFHFFQKSHISKCDSNINCRSTKNKQLCQVWRVLLKKCARHALEKFKMVKGVAGLFFKLSLSNLAKS